MNELARLRWRCRRGTREMDLLLESFLDQCYPDLSTDQQQAFARLLDESDLDILGWVTGKKQPPDRAYLDLIEILRNKKQS